MDLSQYAELFLAESREHLAAINDLLLAWEREPGSREPLSGIFRAVHTLKGTAATMGYQAVAELAHRMEDVLDALRQSGQPPSGELLQLLFRAADLLEAGVQDSVAGRAVAWPQDVIEALRRAAAAASRPEGAKAPVPGSPERVTGEHVAGEGVRVRVVLEPDAPLKGPRALLVLTRAEQLGAVSGVQPPVAAFEREDFAGEFTFWLATSAGEDAIAAHLRGAGDVAEVRVGSVAGEEGRLEAGTVRHVRVDLRRLDRLMNLVGELITARGRLLDVAASRGDAALEEVARRVAYLAGELQHEVVASRMTPVWQVFDRFPRLVRDLAHRLGKRVEFVIEGKEIELDRALLDEIGEPLVHLLRNAVDHGLEAPEERERQGKSAVGRLVLSASREREAVAIRVADDGRGIDRARVLREAIARGWVEPETAALSDEMLVRVLARPGFSTALEVSDVSGRGVGIDVVFTKVRSLGGALEVKSTPGRGTTFTLRLPTSLAIVRALLARVGSERYALPLTHVAETVDLDPRRTTTLEGREALVFRDRLIPLVHLRQVLGSHGDGPARRPVVVVQIGERMSGLVVDDLLGQQEIMVKPFDPPKGTMPIFNGATILGDGAPALILDAAGLV
jgi:two-component system chemotaxis sensor kinase CheA